MLKKLTGPFLTLVLAAALCALSWPHVRNEFFVLLGSRDEAGGWYGWWSGNAGGLQIFEWLVLGGLIYWHHTCHYSPWCLRIGKYSAAGGLFELCHRHHPDMDGERPRHEMIHRLHREHQDRLAGRLQ